MATEQPAPLPLVFPEGLIGCPDWQRFTLERPPELAPMALLVSEDIPNLSLPVVSPWLIKVDYAPQLAEADQLALKAEAGVDLQWLVILNVQREPPLLSANLLGPVVFNPASGLARQVILSLSGYSAMHMLEVAAQPPENEVSHARADATA